MRFGGGKSIYVLCNHPHHRLWDVVICQTGSPAHPARALHPPPASPRHPRRSFVSRIPALLGGSREWDYTVSVPLDWLLPLSVMPSGLAQVVAAAGLTGLAFDGWLGVSRAGRATVGGGAGAAGGGPGCADEGGLPDPLHAWSCPSCALVTCLGVLLHSSFSLAVRPLASPADFRLQPDPDSDRSCHLPCAHMVQAGAPLSWGFGVDPQLSVPLSLPPLLARGVQGPATSKRRPSTPDSALRADPQGLCALCTLRSSPPTRHPQCSSQGEVFVVKFLC